jgi:ferrous iron transport protein B
VGDDPVARAEAQANTAAGRIGKFIEPAIEPLGYDWRIGIGLLGSLAAREVFVSTMNVVYAVEETEDEGATARGVGRAMDRARWDGSDRPVYDLATVLSLLVFYAIALQCLSTVAVVYRETGSVAWTVGQFAGLTALAWLCAWLTYIVAI